jgi:hypothetical protein
LARLAGVGIIDQVADGHCLSTGQNKGGERKERGEREGLGFKLNFLKILNKNMKNFKHESCRFVSAKTSFEP